LAGVVYNAVANPNVEASNRFLLYRCDNILLLVIPISSCLALVEEFMNLDLHTLTLVLGIVNLLQVIAIFSQYLQNKNRMGPGWWLLWSVFTLLGFVLLAFREGAVGSLTSTSIVFASVILLAGQIFLYIGIVQFLGRQESRRLIVSMFTIYILAAVYFTDVVKREAGIVLVYHLSVAVLSFLTMYTLAIYKTRSISDSTAKRVAALVKTEKI
jgi:hypothetical protein